MDYAVGAWWTGTSCRKMDQVQERATRYYCGLPRNATIAGYLSDSGWIPGAVRRDVECLHFYNQLIRMDNNTIAKKVFLLDRREAGPFSKNIKTICRCCEINSSWEQMEAVNVSHAQRKLLELYKVALKSEIEMKPKLMLFAKYYEALEFRKHLTANLTRYERSLISNLRCGSLGIELELGHYENIKRQFRICRCCGKEVEDEMHFLFNCSATDKKRKELMQECPELQCATSDLRRLEILNNKPYFFGKLMQIIWEERNEILT